MIEGEQNNGPKQTPNIRNDPASQDTRQYTYDPSHTNMQQLMQLMQQQPNNTELMQQLIKSQVPVGTPRGSFKDGSILSQEDSVQQRRRMRENLEREFGLNIDY